MSPGPRDQPNEGMDVQARLRSGVRAARRLRRFVLPLLVAAIFVAAVMVLHHELGAAHFHEVTRAIETLPVRVVLGAIGLAGLAYVVLMGYDLLALRFVGARLPLRRVAFASFVSFSFSHNIGLAGLTGASLRYRLYSAWGLDSAQIGALFPFCLVSFWVGLAALGGLVLMFAGPQLGGAWGVPAPVIR